MNISLNIKPNENILVGVSGGADSMCLLHILCEARKSVFFNLYVCHVNHGIRGAEAKRDEDLVVNFAKKLGAEVIVKNVDAIGFSKSRGLTLEEGARILRYDVFDKLRKQLKISKLFLAHNKGDQAETVLMHIARGSSLSGARGMKQQGEFIFRPLLGTSREEILEYNKKNGVPFVNDSTNQDNSYARNFVRNEVLPKLKKQYPNIEDALAKFAKLCARDDDFIEKSLDLSLISAKNNEAHLANKVCILHESQSFRLIKKALEKINIRADFGEVHLKSILEMFGKKSGSRLQLPHGVVCYKDYDGITLVCEQEKPKDEGVVKFDNKTTKVGDKTIKVELKNNIKTFEKGKVYLDKNKIESGAVLRTKRPGDVFKKLGASGSKKLCDYFTDKKIEKRNRDSVVVLANKNNILAVVGYDVSEDVKIDENTKQIVVLSQMPN